jgi:hypothetical protein
MNHWTELSTLNARTQELHEDLLDAIEKVSDAWFAYVDSMDPTFEERERELGTYAEHLHAWIDRCNTEAHERLNAVMEAAWELHPRPVPSEAMQRRLRSIPVV